ncbi:MAG: hypothetical protein M0R75_07655 [Dehalococcoidia bacterium]|nr:hypothetical protein [Dehalococcoidia bacterium]
MKLLDLLRRLTGGKTATSSSDAAEGSPGDRAARESARKYWEREVAEEKVRRGTPDRPR